MLSQTKFDPLAVLLRSATNAVARTVKRLSHSSFAAKHVLYGDSATTSAHALVCLIDAVASISIGDENFRPGAYALNSVSCVVQNQQENKTIRELFDTHAAPLTKRAASWLASERPGYSWAAENYFTRLLPLMTYEQSEDALNAIAVRYEKLSKEQTIMQRTLIHDRYDDLVACNTQLQERMQGFDHFIRRLSPPTPQPAP